MSGEGRETESDLDFATLLSTGASCLRRALGSDNCRVHELVENGKLHALWQPGNRSPKWCRPDVEISDVISVSSSHAFLCPDTPPPHSEEACLAGELLPRLLVPPLKTLFDDPSGANPILWVALMLYDELGARYSFRTLSSPMLTQDERQIVRLLYRASDADLLYKWLWDQRSGRIYDLSDRIRQSYLERGIDPDYCLVLGDDCAEDCSSHTWNVSSITSNAAIDNRATALRAFVHTLSRDVRVRRYLNRINRRPLTDAEISEARKYGEVQLGTAIAHLFRNDGDLKSVESLHKQLVDFRDRAQLTVGRLWTLANYFVWLKALHPKLVSYSVCHIPSFRIDGSGSTAGPVVLKPSGLVLASTEPPEPRLAAKAEVALAYVLGPLNDYYAVKSIRKLEKDQAERDKRQRSQALAAELLERTVIDLKRSIQEAAQEVLNVYPSTVALARESVLRVLAPDDLVRFRDSVLSVLRNSDQSAQRDGACALLDHDDYTVLRSVFVAEHRELKSGGDPAQILRRILAPMQSGANGFRLLALLRRWDAYEPIERDYAVCRWGLISRMLDVSHEDPNILVRKGSAWHCLSHSYSEKVSLASVRPFLPDVQREADLFLPYITDAETVRSVEEICAHLSTDNDDATLRTAWEQLRDIKDKSGTVFVPMSNSEVKGVFTALNCEIDGFDDSYMPEIYACPVGLRERFAQLVHFMTGSIEPHLASSNVRVCSRMVPSVEVGSFDASGIHLHDWHLCLCRPLAGTQWDGPQFRASWSSRTQFREATGFLRRYFRLIAVGHGTSEPDVVLSDDSTGEVGSHVPDHLCAQDDVLRIRLVGSVPIDHHIFGEGECGCSPS